MRPGRAADHSPPSSAAIMEEYGYTSTHPLGHTGLVTRSLYFYLIYMYTYKQVDLVGKLEGKTNWEEQAVDNKNNINFSLTRMCRVLNYLKR